MPKKFSRLLFRVGLVAVDPCQNIQCCNPGIDGTLSVDYGIEEISIKSSSASHNMGQTSEETDLHAYFHTDR